MVHVMRVLGGWKGIRKLCTPFGGVADADVRVLIKSILGIIFVFPACAVYIVMLCLGEITFSTL